ncbi:twin-arginine translocation signal domain-containing protein [Dactylosporangium sp. CA-152071]|uniref:twin-arginine translocation signal domain-containing protein n=1 Tax=Dactylosporangium sp. CA-152071 TaxID=3239933 RepID=UPI003D9126EF
MISSNLLSARLSRRQFVGGAAVAGMALAAGCAHEDDDTYGAGVFAGGPAEHFALPTAKLSEALRILAWSHFGRRCVVGSTDALKTPARVWSQGQIARASRLVRS